MQKSPTAATSAEAVRSPTPGIWDGLHLPVLSNHGAQPLANVVDVILQAIDAFELLLDADDQISRQVEHRLCQVQTNDGQIQSRLHGGLQDQWLRELPLWHFAAELARYTPALRDDDHTSAAVAEVGGPRHLRGDSLWS